MYLSVLSVLSELPQGALNIISWRSCATDFLISTLYKRTHVIFYAKYNVIPECDILGGERRNMRRVTMRGFCNNILSKSRVRRLFYREAYLKENRSSISLKSSRSSRRSRRSLCTYTCVNFPLFFPSSQK